MVARSIRLSNGSMPAKEWVESLDNRGQGQFVAAMRTLENSLRSGRPPAGRASKVRNSSEGVWELRVTKQGGTPPHLRAFFVREGRTLWLAMGITKTQNRLEQRDIDEADRIVAERKGNG